MAYLCTKQEQADAIGQSLTNMYITYYSNKSRKRKKHLDVIDKGSYIVKHDITNEELEFMVNVILGYREVPIPKRIRRCKKTQ
jgi:hypothetical protein